MKRALYSLLFATAAFTPTYTVAGDGDFFLMSGGQIECLAQNADSYLAADEDTLFIKPSDCGSEKTGKVLSFMEMTMNAAPDIKIVEDQDIPDAIVVLTREDLNCIAKQPLPSVASLVAFYPDGCRVVVREP